MKLSNYIINNIWYNIKYNKIYLILLGIFEYLFVIIIIIRKKLYQTNILASYKFNIPILIVGNITVGGTGKTPMVIYLANYLKQQGFNPGIISRGYKSGDEILVLKNNTNCLISINPNRVAAINNLVAKNNTINIIISDDGLQHYKLKRDIEIAMVDGNRLFGNNHLLPLGPLREPVSRLDTVDFIIINNFNNFNLALISHNTDKIYQAELMPSKFYNILNPNLVVAINQFKCNSSIHAVAGIGNNQKFFNLLRQLGFNIIEHAFLDHYNYKERDLEFGDNAPIIMTEKDAVKCVKFAKSNYWYLAVTIEMDAKGDFLNKLKEKISFLEKKC